MITHWNSKQSKSPAGTPKIIVNYLWPWETLYMYFYVPFLYLLDTDTFIMDNSPGCKDVKLYNYDSYLYDTDNTVMQTFGTVPLLSVLLLEAYMYLNLKVEYYALILCRINTRRQ